MKPLPQSAIDPPNKPNAIYSRYLSSTPPQYESSKRINVTTIYSAIFVHSKYLVGCTSNGDVCVWDVSLRQPYDADTENRHSLDALDGCKQLLCVECTPSKTRNVLYDVQFIKEKDLLIISGDPGILIYRWSDFQQSILEDQHSQQTVANNIQPICTFHPHPSPMETIEINSTSYDQTNNILYAAAGDGFGCYQWDLETMQLLGTFAGSNVGPRCHSDYLHVVKVIKDRDVITGGEDGKMGFWNGKERKLVQMYDIQNTMETNKQLVTGQSSNRGFLNNSFVWNNGTNLWISSVETNDHWLAVGGGAEQGHNGVTARSSSTSGFMTLWHLPSRSFTSGCVTRETINAVTYNPSLNQFVTGGNEGRISYWESCWTKRVGRAWCTSPATYCLSVSDKGMMVAGGCGGVDYFVDHVRATGFQL